MMNNLLRIFKIAAVMVIVSTIAASAGDFAKREIIGFSANGDVFAFEEYGVQDGSGFAYSNIYVVDTHTDQWVAGSPFRVQSEDETTALSEVRQQAKTSAASALSPITEPGTINATNQPLEIVDNPHRMTVRPWDFTPPTSERLEFRIEQLPMLGQDFCSDFGEVYGFRLIKTATKIGETTQLLHEDTQIPNSRGCPLRYRFADIVTRRIQPSGELVVAVLILYETVGFEGPDGRYLAVTKRFAKQ